MGVGTSDPKELPQGDTAFSAGARTASPTPYEFRPGAAVGIEARYSTSAPVGAASVVFSIEAYNAASDGWNTVIASASVTTATSGIIIIDPRIPASNNIVAQRGLKPRLRLVVTHANGDSITYNVRIFAYR